MKSVSSQMVAHLGGAVTTLCSCWKITRTDGEVLGFTDHDVELTLGTGANAVTYNASSGFFRSAIANSATTQADNLEVKGFLDDNAIGEDDLLQGKYDYADVEVFMVNWKDTTQGRVLLRKGKFGEVTRYPSGLFIVELRGLMQLLEQTIGEIYQPECRADLFDYRCRFFSSSVGQQTKGYENLNQIPPSSAPLRAAGKYYYPGDRVVYPVGSTAGFSEIELPLKNGDFEDFSINGLFGITLNGGSITNQAITPKNGVTAMKPNASTGNMAQVVNQPYAAVPVDSVVSQTQCKIACARTGGASGQWEVALVLDMLNSSSVVLSTASTGWVPHTGPTDVYEDITVIVPTPNPAATLYRYTLFWRPVSGQGGSGAAPFAFDDVRYTAFVGSVEYTNASPDLKAPDFEVGGDEGDMARLADWYAGPNGFVQYARRAIAGAFLAPQNEDAYALSMMAAVGEFEQTVTLLPGGGGVTTSLIDAENYEIELNGFTSAIDNGWMYRLKLSFYNNGGGILSSGAYDLDTGYKDIIDIRHWKPTLLKGDVPPGARSVRVLLMWQNQPQNTATTPQVAFDNFRLVMRKKVVADWLDMGGVEFEAMNGGVTAANDSPTFNGTLNALTTDGTISWKAVTPTHLFTGQVTAVTNYTHFTASGLGSKPDQWFQWGVLEFLTGRNAGRRMEVKESFANGTMHMMLPMYFEPQVGDYFRVTTGCDKHRDTCKSKFNNLLNFRGEPDVPGTGMYFKVAGA